MWPWPGGVESAGRWRRRILRLSPAALLVSSYLAGMMVGTLLLKMPWATRGGIAWTDALFTATSALCVTGLTVVDTGTFFTTAGQVVILCLIQIGGLGIMTFAVFILVSAGWRLSTQQRFCIQDSFSTDASSDLRRLVLFVVWFAVVAELAGSAALALCLKDLDLGQRLYFGLFHAVSAFCNAGFGLYPDSLARYYDDWLLNFTVAGLIILGGLGFPVLFEVISWLRQRKRPRFSLHTRLALLSSGVLIGAGLVAFWALEHRNCLAGMPLSVQLLVSFFSP